jgi:hypothetical protein
LKPNRSTTPADGSKSTGKVLEANFQRLDALLDGLKFEKKRS